MSAIERCFELLERMGYDFVLAARTELAGYTEIGPCGKHLKMFWHVLSQGALSLAPITPHNFAPAIAGYCSLCREIEQSVEREVAGMRGAMIEGLRRAAHERGVENAYNFFLDSGEYMPDSSAAQRGKQRIREEALREAATLICHYCGKGEYPHRVGSDTGNWYHGEMLSPCKAAGMYNQYPTLALIDKPGGR